MNTNLLEMPKSLGTGIGGRNGRGGEFIDLNDVFIDSSNDKTTKKREIDVWFQKKMAHIKIKEKVSTNLKINHSAYLQKHQKELQKELDEKARENLKNRREFFNAENEIFEDEEESEEEKDESTLDEEDEEEEEQEDTLDEEKEEDEGNEKEVFQDEEETIGEEEEEEHVPDDEGEAQDEEDEELVEKAQDEEEEAQLLRKSGWDPFLKNDDYGTQATGVPNIPTFSQDLEEALELCSGTFNSASEPDAEESILQSENDISDEEFNQGPAKRARIASLSSNEIDVAEESKEPYDWDSRVRKRVVADMIEEEADLSGDDVGSDEDDEGENEYEPEEGDNDETLDHEEIKNNLARQYLKRQKDADERHLALLNEQYFGDVELGSGRTDRNFRFRVNNDNENVDWTKLMGKLEDEEDENSQGLTILELNPKTADRVKWKVEQESKKLKEVSGHFITHEISDGSPKQIPTTSAGINEVENELLRDSIPEINAPLEQPTSEKIFSFMFSANRESLADEPEEFFS